MINTFETVKSLFLPRQGVELSKMFGSQGLKINGKVFAMEVKGQLVVKLSSDRAAQLVAQKQASVFDPGHGRLMKQWIAIPIVTELDWCALAGEALTLVAQ